MTNSLFEEFFISGLKDEFKAWILMDYLAICLDAYQWA